MRESEKVQEFRNKYAYVIDNKKGKEHLMPILKEIQTKEKYVPKHAIIAISNALQVPLAHVYGVVTFYNFFKLEKQGDFVIALCEGTTCHIEGAPKITEAIKKKIGIGPGEMTKDGKFSFEIVRCLGLCAFAPVMLVNEKQYTKVIPEKIEEILEGYLKQ